MRDFLSEHAMEITQYREWLLGKAQRDLGRWERRLSQDPESGICEAVTRAFLIAQGAAVESCEDPSKGGPDFLCTVDGRRFSVEVTCVTVDKVTSKSNLSDDACGACHYRLLTTDFRSEISNKVSQCSGLGHPCLVAIATLHQQGGIMCFGERAIEDLLTGTGKIAMQYDAASGQGIGEPYQSTSLRDSAFIRFVRGSSNKLEFARYPISGVLLCAFGYPNPEVVGALHPNPNHRFDRTLLPDVRFAKLTDGSLETGELEVKWF